MNKKQIDHINDLINMDELLCNIHIRAIDSSDYSEEAKNILTGYYRDRASLNQQILDENGFHGEKNINAKSKEEC
jgi:hypothetical protein